MSATKSATVAEGASRADQLLARAAGMIPTLRTPGARSHRDGAGGFVTVRDGSTHPKLSLTEEGRRVYVLPLAIDGRSARQALAGFAPREITDFAGYLRRVIANTGSGSPEVWAGAESQHP